MGLGHLRRHSTIAARLVHDLPGASVLLMTGLPSGCWFDLPPGVDFVKLPSVTKMEAGLYRPSMPNLGAEKVRALRASTIKQIAEVFEPDLLLVDHSPIGLWRELLPTLRLLKARARPTKLVLGLRDVLDTPEATREHWQAAGVYAAIKEFYDAILIYGSRHIFDSVAQYGLTDDLASRVSFCGYLTNCQAQPGTTTLLKDPDRAQRKLVVVTVGGGADGLPIMRMCLEAVRVLGPDCAAEFVFLTGPLMPRDQRQSLQAQAAGLPVHVLGGTDESRSYLAAADLIVTMAGYNTLTEAIRLGKRLLVIPRQGPSAEQRIRAGLFAELGLLRKVDPQRASPTEIARDMLNSLDASPPAGRRLDLEGLNRAVDALIALLDFPGSGQDNDRLRHLDPGQVAEARALGGL